MLVGVYIKFNSRIPDKTGMPFGGYDSSIPCRLSLPPPGLDLSQLNTVVRG